MPTSLWHLALWNLFHTISLNGHTTPASHDNWGQSRTTAWGQKQRQRGVEGASGIPRLSLTGPVLPFLFHVTSASGASLIFCVINNVGLNMFRHWGNSCQLSKRSHQLLLLGSEAVCANGMLQMCLMCLRRVWEHHITLTLYYKLLDEMAFCLDRNMHIRFLVLGTENVLIFSKWSWVLMPRFLSSVKHSFRINSVEQEELCRYIYFLYNFCDLPRVLIISHFLLKMYLVFLSGSHCLHCSFHS